MSTVRAVKVSNVSVRATEHDIKEFFSFSGEIESIDMHPENEQTQTVYVTFKHHQGADTAALLSGATIVDQSVVIAFAPDYNSPHVASVSPTAAENKSPGPASPIGSAVRKAEDVVGSMLAKGFTLSKDALNKAKAFDEQHQLTSTATAKVASLDQKIGLSEKISAGTTIVNEKVKEMDQKFQVSEKTKSAIASAEQTVSSAGSAIMKNRYVMTGASWVTGAFNRVVAKSPNDLDEKTEDNKVREVKGEEVDHQGTKTPPSSVAVGNDPPVHVPGSSTTDEAVEIAKPNA